MAKSILYFITRNENNSSVYGIDPLFLLWVKNLVGESMHEVLECVKELENLVTNFEVEYPTLSNIKDFESHLLT
jgi:hypothetical protein